MLALLLYNLLAISLPLAIIEILIEKDKGWGNGWDKSKWYAKPFLSNSKFFASLFNFLKQQHPLNYHVLIFGVIIPIVLIFEYILVSQNLLLLLAIFIAILIAEDFLWFLLNWNFDSLKQLLMGPTGSIWWHKSWTKLTSKYYLPTVYFTGTAAVLFLYLLARYKSG